VRGRRFGRADFFVYRVADLRTEDEKIVS
jgi:hypothetical protein